MQLGYHLDRIRSLSQRTGFAVHDLSSIYCSDPAAASALRSLRLTRQNLEEHWMPLLRQIEASEAMITWHSTPLAIRNPDGSAASFWAALDDASTRHSPQDERISARFLALSNDELASEFQWMGIDMENLRLHDEDYRSSDVWHEFSLASDVVAGRIATDDSFAHHFLQFPRNLPAFALTASANGYDDRFVTKHVARLLALNSSNNPWDSGLNDTRDAYVIETGLRQLTKNPSAALDLLSDSGALFGLAEWNHLDQTVVAEVVFAGLYTAVADDMDRLVDGYAVLADLTIHANGPLESGMTAGVAQAVANSMIGYIDTLAPKLDEIDNDQISIVTLNPDSHIDIGTYADLVDLFGSIMRDPEAQAILGTTMGAHLDYLASAGVGIDRFSEAVQFAGLLSHSAKNESIEMMMYAAAEEARRRQLGQFVGFFSKLALKRFNPVGALLGGQAVDKLVDLYANVDPEELGSLDIASYTSKILDVALIGQIANDPLQQIKEGLGEVTAQQWRRIDYRLQAVDAADNPEEQYEAIKYLRTEVKLISALSIYLTEQRAFAGIKTLTHGESPEVDT